MTEGNKVKMDRRKAIKALTAAGATALAGCNADNSGSKNNPGDTEGGENALKGKDGGNELGERVPTIELEYWTSLGGLTRFFESSLPQIEKDWKNRLGLDLEIRGQDIATQWSGTMNDERTHHFAYWGYTTSPDRLDPNFAIKTLRIDNAGANGRQNGANYASCEHGVPGFEQEIAPSVEKRKDLVAKAEYAQSKDVAMIPTGRRARIGAARSDQIDPKQAGSLGIQNANPFFLLNSFPKDNPGRRIIGSTTTGRLENINPLRESQWGQPSTQKTIHSPLITPGPDGELTSFLAEDWNVENNAKEIIFSLYDTTFHDGRPLTAEDVKFTYDLINEYAEDLAPAANVRAGAKYTTEAIDDTTFKLTFEEPALSFLQASVTQITILNKGYWQENGGHKSPGSFRPEPGHQSGPFKPVQLTPKQSLTTDLHTDHPKSPDTTDKLGGLILQGFRGETSLTRAFNNGKIDYMTDLSKQTAARLREQENAFVSAGMAGHTYHLNPQYSFGPTKFRPFRLAVAKALNRRKIRDLTDPSGEEDIIYHVRQMLEPHPYSPPTEGYTKNGTKITDSPTGEIGGAQQVLLDAGWGWDENGNLRYPADADLSPRWPKGSQPQVKDHPCLCEFSGARSVDTINRDEHC